MPPATRRLGDTATLRTLGFSRDTARFILRKDSVNVTQKTVHETRFALVYPLSFSCKDEPTARKRAAAMGGYVVGVPEMRRPKPWAAPVEMVVWYVRVDGPHGY